MLSIMNILIPLLTISSLVRGNRYHPRQLSSAAPASVIVASNIPFSTSSSSPSTSTIIDSCDWLDSSNLVKPSYLSHFLAVATAAASITNAQPTGNITVNATMSYSTTTTQSLTSQLISSSVIYPNVTISSTTLTSNTQSSSYLSPTDTGQSTSSLISTSSTPLSSSAALSSTRSSNLLSLTDSLQSTWAQLSISIIAPLPSLAATPPASSNALSLTPITQTSSVLQNPVFTQLTVVVPSVTATFTTSVANATQTPNITPSKSGSSLLNSPKKLVPIVVGVVVSAAVLVGLFEV